MALKFNDLLKGFDEDFIRHIYKKILKREPDEQGKRHYLHLLRSGEKSRKQIAIDIMSSLEAKDKEKIDLYLLYRIFYKIYEMPYIGYLARIFISCFRLPTLVKSLRKCENDLYVIQKTLDRLVKDYLLKVDIKEFEGFRDGIMMQLSSKIDKERFETLKDNLIIEMKSNFKVQNKELINIEKRMETYISLVKSFLQRKIQSSKKKEKLENTLEKMYFDLFYTEFENEFRGNYVEIKKRLSKYLPIIKGLKAPILVLDCGCGRGEWLDLLEENGIRAVGVDINEHVVKTLKQRGFEVYESDINAFLKDKKEIFSAVTAFQVIEHLPLEYILTFLKLSYEALKFGGVIILETPNPKNITVGACNFYTDLTHIKPIPPRTSKFLLEFTGFKDVIIEPFKKETGNFSEDWLNQPDDYAVIGFKK